MRIISLMRFLCHLAYVKRQFNKRKKLLVPGRYILMPSMRSFSLDDPGVFEVAKKYFPQTWHSRVKCFVVSVLNKLGAFTNRKQGGCYQAMYIANKYDKVREVKLFSFCENKILTICTSSVSFEKQLDQYQRLSFAYSMPPVVPMPDCENSYEIEMITLLPRGDAISALQEIAEAHMKFFATKGHFSVEKILGDMRMRAEYADVVRTIKEKLSFGILTVEFPLCMQHGDLSQDNLMYGTCAGEKGYWWIDWEHEGLRLFYYDFFFYILNSAYCTHDLAPLHTYLRGECDGILKKWFELAGIQYCEAKREEYLWVYFLSFLNERVHTVDTAQNYLAFLEMELQAFGAKK